MVSRGTETIDMPKQTRRKKTAPASRAKPRAPGTVKPSAPVATVAAPEPPVRARASRARA
jgi:hypothetical protein